MRSSGLSVSTALQVTEAHLPTLRKSPEEIRKTGQPFTGVLASASRLAGGVQVAHGASEILQAHGLVYVKCMPLISVTSSEGTPKRSCCSGGSFCWVWTQLCNLLHEIFIWIHSYPLLKEKKIDLHVWVFACLSVFIPCVCPVSMEVRRRHQIPWNWSDGWYETLCGWREPNLGPQQDQQVILTAKPSLLSLLIWF